MISKVALARFWHASKGLEPFGPQSSLSGLIYHLRVSKTVKGVYGGLTYAYFGPMVWFLQISIPIMNSLPPLFDRQLLARRQLRARDSFPEAAFLWERAALDIAHTLSAINRQFTNACDLSARNGLVGELIRSELPTKCTNWHEFDLNPGPTQKYLDLEDPHLPLDYDLMISILALDKVNDLRSSLAKLVNHLRPDGLFIGIVFGGETLWGVRQCLMQAEMNHRQGAGARLHPVIDPADMIDLLRISGLNMPVVDHEVVRVNYDSPLALLKDIRAMGEASVLVDRPRLGLSRAIVADFCRLYAERFSDQEGRINADFDLVTLSGWKPHESQQIPLKPGSAKVRLADALGVPEIKL